jgi:hypothetical protein
MRRFVLMFLLCASCAVEEDLVAESFESLTGYTAPAAAYTVLPPVSGCSRRLYAAPATSD